MTINLQNGPPLTLYLGRQGENDAKTFSFDFSSLEDNYGQGILTLVAQRSTDKEPYPVALSFYGTVALWTVSNVDTSIPGTGKAQFTYTADGKIKKTVIYSTVVEKSLVPSSDESPDPYDDWLENLNAIGSRVSEDATLALSEIETAKTAAVQDVSTARSSAIGAVADRQETAMQAIGTQGTEIIDLADAAARNASLSAASASGSATSAAQSAQSAAQYAGEARSYAENLHFTEDGDGTVVISVGG